MVLKPFFKDLIAAVPTQRLLMDCFRLSYDFCALNENSEKSAVTMLEFFAA